MTTPATTQPDRLFHAFADRTRLRLLNLLREGEACVGDLVAVIQAPQPTISRHLGSLRRAGLVEAERAGNWCFYRLAAPAGAFHERLLDCLACCFAETPQLQRDARALARLRRRGGCCARDDRPSTPPRQRASSSSSPVPSKSKR